MFRGAIIIFLVNYCAFLFSQQLQFSRRFDALDKNLPLAILNNNPRYFHLLRFNKLAHDITIECRGKPSAERIAFTALRLDSVNASWFDYEKLDYLFFENQHKVYFLFEKELNFKKTIYLKVIDTTGKSSGFIELASLEKDKASFDFRFSFKLTATNDILIVASKTSYGGMRRKIVLLYDTDKGKMAWTKKLPLEDAATDASDNFECNKEQDLFYLSSKLDSLFLVKWNSSKASPRKKILNTSGMTGIKGISLTSHENDVFISMRGLNEEKPDYTVDELFVNYKIDSAFINTYKTITNYDPSITKQLTFYDGPQKESWFKSYDLLKAYVSGDFLFSFYERIDGYFYKELFYYKTDLNTGKVVSQYVIPRKIFFFKNRTRFKNLGKVMFFTFGDRPCLVILESPHNLKKKADYFNYRSFIAETDLWYSNIMMYTLTDTGTLEKKLIYSNSDFDLVPLQYSSGSSEDIVFYFNGGKYEKFGFLKVDKAQ